MADYLVDANIIIYAVMPDFGYLEDIILTQSIASVTLVETLGYHAITPSQEHHIRLAINAMRLLDFDERVWTQAIRLRQSRSMSIGDAIVAATTIVHGLALLTHNVKDFAWISQLEVIDPLD